MTYTYTPRGSVKTIKDQLNNVTAYTYDAVGRTKTVTDAESVVTEYFYDAVGNTVRVEKNGHIVSRSDYDNVNRTVKAYDGRGEYAQYAYDGVGNVLTYTDRNGNPTSYTYDKNYRTTEVKDAENYTRVTEYDSLGRVTKSKDKNGNATTYIYEPNGNVKSVTDALGSSVSYTYDAMNRTTATTDKLGAVTEYTYDLTGNTLSVKDNAGKYSHYTYDDNGNRTLYTNRENEWVKYDYDVMNRISKETNQLNHATSYIYDLAGNLITYSDRNRHETTYAYDGVNRLKTQTNAEGGIEEYAYNYLGKTATFTAYGGNGQRAVTTYTYDLAGNLTEEKSPLNYKTSYTYDAEGNVLTKTDENSKTTTYTYDKVNNPVKRVNADGETNFTYDGNGNLKTATDTNGTVAFTYDELNRATHVANEDGTTTSYAYNAASSRTSITYPDTTAVTTAYDVLGRVTSVMDYDGTSITYTRDAEGRATKAAHSDGSTTEYDYNSAGQLTLQKEVDRYNSTRRSITYTYDDEGNLVSELRTGVDYDRRDENVRYYYDKANRLVKTVVEGVTVNYVYDLAGNLTSDGEFAYTYDLQNRLTKKGDTSYTYDNAGNLISDGEITYTYNAQNKLVKGENTDGESSEYTYNALGVRIQNVQVRENANAGYQNSNLIDGSGGEDYLPYLRDGRFDWQRVWESEIGTTVQNNFETVTRNYISDYLSLANRDILVTEDGSFTERYVYDAAGIRVSAEFGYADGTHRGEGGENLASDFAANEVQKVWYRSSLTGSSLFAVDADGEVAAHAIYDPWGNPLTETYTDANWSGIDNLNNFTGYAWDEVLNLYYAQNRFYDAENHRFTQEDPVKSGANWFVYCGNNPVINVDPTGLLPWSSFDEFFHQVKSDSQGRTILLAWLYGEGKERNYENNKSWAKYMTANEILSEKIKVIVKGYYDKVKCGETVYFDETMAIEIDNEEQIIGYQYLHGTNADVGGFNIRGTIAKNKEGAATISLTYQWNDIIDPNFYYSTDSAKAKFADSIPFANPTDYIIRISWADVSTTDKNGVFNSGWLADKWKYIKNPDHTAVVAPPTQTDKDSSTGGSR